MRKHDTAGVFHLVVEKFAEVFHIHFALGRVNDGAKRVDFCVFHFGVGYRFNDVG